MNISNFQMTNLKNRQFTNGEFLKTQMEPSNFSDFLKTASVPNKNMTNVAPNTKASKSFASKMLHPEEYFTSSSPVNRTRERLEKKGASEDRVHDRSASTLQAKHSYQQMRKGYEVQGGLELTAQKDSDAFDEKTVQESEAAQNLQLFLQAISTMIEQVKALEVHVQERLLEGIEPLEQLQALEINLESLVMGEDLKAAEELVQDMEAFYETMKEALSTQMEAHDLDPKSQNALQDLFEALNVSSVKVQELKTKVLQSNEDVTSEESADEFLVTEQKPEREQNLDKVDHAQDNARSSQMFLNSDKAIAKAQTAQVTEDFDEFTNALHSLDRELKADLIGIKTATGLIKNTSVQEIYSQIKEGMSKIDLSASMQEIVIKLKPEELGKVELKLELYKDLVIARFDVESQAVKEAIESNLKDLRSSLEQSGFTNMQFDVNVNDDGEGAGRENFVFSRGAGANEIELNEQIQEKNAWLSLNAMVEETGFEYLA